MGGLQTTGALGIFAAVLLAYTLQTELAQIVQQTQGYRKPYFLFYLTHSGYLLLAPLHLAALRILSIPIVPSLYTLLSILQVQFAPPRSTSQPSPAPPSHRPSYSRSLSRASLPSTPTLREDRPGVRRRTSKRRLLGRGRRDGRWGWAWRMASTVLKLSILIAAPALSWYAAMPLTAVTDITAIYNTFAFWAYGLAVVWLGETPTRAKLASVVVAVLGVFVIAYGDSWMSSSVPEDGGEEERKEGTSRLIGNLLAFFGSVSYAWYEVWYKINVALPDPDELEGEDDDDEEEAESFLASPTAMDPSESTDDADPEAQAPPSPHSLSSHLRIASPPPASLTNPTVTTFLLYSNLLTSLIGLATLLLFWIPIPIFHYLDWEHFEVPPSNTWLPIIGIVLSGVCFNAGFMILLSLWGPVVASVGNLLTLMFVALADAFLPNSPPLSMSSIVGSGLIVASFAGLIVGARRESQQEEEKARQQNLG
ncbi:hypothetical protein BCR35DRAFT_326000 [Leucosporidium creatinivorum]|uniref:EamA domain-containing protein n=1 Tax=Leucosporidium creatinivorum TaxID=106004 RepID=A0A1Y2ER72_9BASI|nr:hypothetical protein BCR35DRAFT_326000 [Leucosporidium creatinivorum]